MTAFRIDEFFSDRAQIEVQASLDRRYENWPVVYTIDQAGKIYVGESLNVAARLRQHLDSRDKQDLRAAKVILDKRFNKSVCLDLESRLIGLLAGDGQFEVLNRNEGITNAEYYGRDEYQHTFDEIFEALRLRGVFQRPAREIANSDLFKLSPFKALSPDQLIAVEDILTGLFDDLEHDRRSQIVIQGDPGTGKTVIGVFLMKMLSDIKVADTSVPADSDSMLSEFFVEGFPELLENFRVGLVVPQQSLRQSIKKVFKKTPGLHDSMVLTPFGAGEAEERFDLLIVDEAHRLNQRANQPSGVLNAKFKHINERLFGADDLSITQLDWITAKSDHQIFLLDAAQSIRPHDVSPHDLAALLDGAEGRSRHYLLTSQMRVQAQDDYVSYVRGVLSDAPPQPMVFERYDLRLFDDLGEMRRAVRTKDVQHGLSRLVAGYAWPWRSRKEPASYDIELDGERLRWNKSDVDWVNSPGSTHEVGSIHTIQGYDLNYAGVIIGNDLRYDPQGDRLFFDRASHFDKKGLENNPARGITYTDEDILRFIKNVYAVLLTRGMLGTYVYVCDPGLREYLRRFFAAQRS